MHQLTKTTRLCLFAVATIVMWYPPQVTAQPTTQIRKATGEIAQPHARLRISERTLINAATQTETFDAPVREEILGAIVTGASKNHVTVTPRLLPAFGILRFALDLDTSVFTETISRKSAASVLTKGVTKISGQKIIDFDGQRFAMRPTQATAKTNSQIVGFKWGRRLGANVARKEAQNSKAASEQVSARRAANRAQRRMDQQVNRRLEEFAASLRRAFEPIDNGNTPVEYQLATYHGFAELNVQVGTQFQGSTAAEQIPVSAADLQHDLELQIREDLVNQLVNQALAGRKFDEANWESEFANLLPTGLSDVPTSSLKVADPNRAWEISFDADRGATIRFEDGQLKMEFHLSRIRAGQDEIPAMSIAANYKLATIFMEDGRPRATLLRDDRLGVRFGEADPTKRRGVRQQVFRSMVRKRFDPIFAEEIPVHRMLRQSRLAESLRSMKLGQPMWSLDAAELRIVADAEPVARQPFTPSQSATPILTQ